MPPAATVPTRRALLFGVAVGAVLVASLADPWAYAHLTLSGVYDRGWARLLRPLGYLPLWLLVGYALYRNTTTTAGRRHAILLAAAPTLSGALGEILKLLIRRERPGLHHGLYVFRSFADRPFASAGFGMPSGDAIVAFAAGAILARIWPRTRLLWYALAGACAIARVLSRAHFLSDVTVAGFLGWAVADVLWRRFAVVQEPTAATPA